MKLRYFLAAALALIALTFVAYHALPTRSFAADDFQWLLGAHRLSFGAMLRSAFDPSQSHFYRPVIWISFWLQAHVFDLDPRGYHILSLVLHLANALLVGALAYRLTTGDNRQVAGKRPSYRSVLAFALPAALVALHPAPFEAVVWVSGQSDLIAAFWLLLMLHSWLWAARHAERPSLLAAGCWLLALLFLALALLTKEIAVIGLPLVVLLGVYARHEDTKIRRHGDIPLSPAHPLTRLPLLLAALLTIAYLTIQLRVERANYIVGQGGYGIGPQLLLNPLRSLGLLVAPLPGSEHADAPWLIGVGAAVALLLVWLLVQRRALLAVLALGLTLLPTAPFVSPPDSRYLYAPVIAGAVLVSCLIPTKARRQEEPQSAKSLQTLTNVSRPVGGVVAWWLLVFTGIVFATAEVNAREQRFATATGADGSLFQVAAARCANGPTDRVIVLNPPIAEIHARAILDLACGNRITPIFVDSMAIAEDNLEPNSLIIAFPGGSAQIVRQM